MAKRISRPLLVGLGATLSLGFNTLVGVIATQATASIDTPPNRLLINSPTIADYRTIPDYNRPERHFFIDTTNLKRFHFGNTQRGTTLTPWGWLRRLRTA